jgi:hypothetical protein
MGPTCQAPLSAPGPAGSAPLPRGCHALRHTRALNAMSGPPAGVPTASCCSDRAPFRPHHRRCPNRLASPRPVPITPSPLSEATPPLCPNPADVRPSDAVASFVHGERRPSSLSPFFICAASSSPSPPSSPSQDRCQPP